MASLSDVQYTLHRAGTVDGAEQVTLAEAKKWLRLLGSDEDDLVTGLIESGTHRVQDALGRAVLRSTWELTYHSNVPPGSAIRLPRPPFVSLESVEAYEVETDSWDVVDVADYVVPISSPQAVVRPADGKTWPNCPLRFKYTAGYANTSAPWDVKNAVLEVVAWLFEHRGDEPSQPGVGGASGPQASIRKRFPHLVVFD